MSYTTSPAPTVRENEDEIDLREVYDLIKSGRWTILGFVIVALLLGVFYVVFARPVYSVSGTVQVDEEKPGAGGLMSALGAMGSLLSGAPVQAVSEVQILQSRLVIDPAINKLHLLVSAEPHYFPVIGRKIAGWLGKDANTPVAAPPLLGRYAWGGESITVGMFETPTAWYDKYCTLTATADGGYRLTGPKDNVILAGKVGVEAAATTAHGPVHLLVTHLTARPGETFRLVRRARQTELKAIHKNLSVTELGSGVQKSNVIEITYNGHNAVLAGKFIDAIQDSYLAQNVERSAQKSKKSLAFLEAQLPDLQTRLDGARDRLAHYQQTHGAADIANETQLLLKQSVALQTQRSQLVRQREQALQRFTPEHPVVQGLDKQLETIESEQAALQGKIAHLPNTQQDVLGLMRNLDVDTQLYTAMLDAIQQFQVSQAGIVGNVRIVDRAMVPLKPRSPKKALALALALVLGGFLGVAWVFVRRAMLRGVDDPAVIETRLGLTVLASIPFDPAQRKLGRAVSRGGRGAHLLAKLEHDNAAIESLRSLQTSLHFAMLEAPNNVVMFTGPAPGIGKSFVSANFGAVLAETGKRVVVVDLDLRKGHLEKYFDCNKNPGFSEFVAGDAELGSILQPCGIQGLDFIASGSRPPNPAALLMHARVQTLIKALSAQYDHVILDTPPVLNIADAAIVGRLAGTTVLVLRSAEHPLREIADNAKRLTSAGTLIRGVLLNQVGARAGSYGYGSYGHSYYHNET